MFTFTILYRRVLRELVRLPGDIRAVGWEHVRQEFRLHKDIKDKKRCSMFISEWSKFLDMYRGSGSSNDAFEDTSAFTNDQSKRLELLRKELRPDRDDLHKTEK